MIQSQVRGATLLLSAAFLPAGDGLGQEILGITSIRLV